MSIVAITRAPWRCRYCQESRTSRGLRGIQEEMTEKVVSDDSSIQGDSMKTEALVDEALQLLSDGIDGTAIIACSEVSTQRSQPC